MNSMMPKFGVGASALRKEDRPLLTGQGNYADDNQPDGSLQGFVVRSPHAAASFTITSVEAAASAPGVHLVMTAADIASFGDVPCLYRVRDENGKPHEVRDQPVLCRDRVRFSGDAVAFVVAESRAQAEDAAELIEIDWTMDDAQVDLATTLDADAVKVWPELGSNIAYDRQYGDKAVAASAFASAHHVTRLSILNNRVISHYMEPRAAVAEHDAATGVFTLTTGSQGVHNLRNAIADRIMKIDRDKLVVLTGDVGGGFGTKGFVYREYPLVLEAARHLGRPVKWVSSRTEHSLADTHGRASLMDAELALDANGKAIALKIDMIADMGAYLSQYGPMIPTFARAMATGVYDIPILDMRIRAVYTNTTPVDAYRGAGRPEAAYLIERLMEAAARETGLSVDEIRRRNFIRPEQFPYKTPGGRTYDVGEFEGHLDRALQLVDQAGFPDRLEQAKSRGKIRGLGLSTYVEACAFEGSEPAKLELNADGTITLYIGTQTNGQGHATAYSQFIADKIGIDFDKIIVRQGDTRDLAAGGGTGGSRSIPLGGVSVSRASEVLAEKMRKLAGDELEAAPEDIELVDGVARVMGTDRQVDYAGLAKAAKTDDDRLAIADVVQDEATYPNGTHAVEVEIDPETGVVEIVTYQIVDDFGVTVNPVLLLGQIHGGVAQGVGQALCEGVVFSPEGQPLTATLMDYAVPRADMFCSFDFETRNVPSKTNALGIKGAGEAATIGATPAVVNAVIDALYRAYGITAIDMPATPFKIWQAIQDATTHQQA